MRHSQLSHFINQCLPHGQIVWMIDVQNGNGGTADGSLSSEPCTLPLEVIRPCVGPGMVQTTQLTCDWIDASDIGSLEPGLCNREGGSGLYSSG